MNAEDRDHAFDRLLRQRAISADKAADCPDAEVLAAWMDGGLDSADAVSTESHMAACARCQALVATMTRAAGADRTEAPSSGAAEVPWWRLNIRWLVPMTAGVTAALLWTMIPDQQNAASIAERQIAPATVPGAPPQAPAPPANAPESDAVDQQAPQKARPAEPGPALEEKRADRSTAAGASSPRREAAAVPEAAPKEEELFARKSLPPASPDSAAAEAAAEPAAPAPTASATFGARVPAGFAAAVEVPTPDTTTRWRIVGGSVERTADGGQTWIGVETGDPASILAGSAPSADVCWLVGRAGAVLVTTDARAWRRMPAPSTADLVEVTATDHLNAVVKTADGQTFRTMDAGTTWTVSPP